jgi:predicted transcriptional regulator
MTDLKAAASEYFQVGCSVVPVNANKKPFVEWAKWQTGKQSLQEFEALPWLEATSYGVVCGTKLNNGLYFSGVDFDVKNLPIETIEKGRQALKELPITQMEETPSKGQHWIYYVHNKPKTVSALHNDCALELLGEGKLCIMAPSQGYKRLNDNTPTVVQDLEDLFYKALYTIGVKAEKSPTAWFDREDLTVKTYEGDHPLCIRELLKGVDQGLRNEAAIRLSSYLVNFRGMGTEKGLWHLKRWNKLNSPSLTEEELLEVFKSSLKGYVFGCNDPLLKNHCTEGVYCPLRKKEQKQPEKEKVFDEATLSKARIVLADPEFFYKLGKVFEEGFTVPKINKPRFVVGEERNKRLLGPLLIGAAKLGMTSIIKVLGEPGTAKDTLLRMWLVLLPIKSVERSYMTAASLRYSPDMQNADLLYIPDTPELQGEMGRQLRFMRSDDGGLISEYAVRDTETGEMTTKVVTLPIKGLATTSNAITGDAALESGMWTLTTNPSPELTKEVKKEKLKLRAGERPLISNDDLNLWQAVFKILVEEEPQEIPLVLYAKQLFDLLESERSESRRDPDRLCDLISLVAWMRRFQKTPEKRMEADLTDLYFALQLGLDAITQTISELSPREQQIFDAIKGTVAVTCREVADNTKIPYKTCYNYLEKLVDKGYLNQDKDKNRNMYSILSNTKPKSFLFSVRRDAESPEQLVKVVSDTIRNSRTEQLLAGDTYTFVDPLKGYRIIVRQKEEQDEVTIDTQEYVYPSPTPAQKRSSEPSKESISDSENKPNSFLLTENRAKNSLEDIIFNTKELGRLTTDFGIGTCALCGFKGRMDWQATHHDGSWDLLCADCGCKLAKKMREVE